MVHDIFGMVVFLEKGVQVSAVLVGIGRQQVGHYHRAAQRMVPEQKIQERTPSDFSRVEGRPLAADKLLRPLVSLPLLKRNVEKTVMCDGEGPKVFVHAVREPVRELPPCFFLDNLRDGRCAAFDDTRHVFEDIERLRLVLDPRYALYLLKLPLEHAPEHPLKMRVELPNIV